MKQLLLFSKNESIKNNPRNSNLEPILSLNFTAGVTMNTASYH